MSAPDRLRVASGTHVADRAVQAADAAAHAAGVTVTTLVDLPDLERVVDLFAAVWGRSATPPVSLELLRAFTKAGNYVGGAFEGDRLVGACVGFFHAPGEDALHSHIAGVASSGRSVGFALKLHQRSWALLHGVSEIAWTFDPLVSRNAHFNLVKLAARATEYLPNFYGRMDDDINREDDTDRLLVRWRLGDPAVELACDGATTPADAQAELAAGACVALGVGDDGGPVPGTTPVPGTVATTLVAVPTSIEEMRVSDPALAQRWRLALRETLGALLADGGHVDGFDRHGWYVVRSAR